MRNNLNSKTVTLYQLARLIDHSLLLPELTEAEAIEGCRTAKKYHCVSVCIKPCFLELAVKELAGSDVAVGTVLSFPHGNGTIASKVFEAKDAMSRGATELDLVLNIGALRSGKYDLVREEVRQVVEAAAGKALVKVILENAYLSDEQKRIACKLCDEAGADFVKTSTGFAPTGCTLPDLALMFDSVSERMQVKAAHGVKTLDQFFEVIDAGVTRVGIRFTTEILEDFRKRFPERCRL
jgi:deoxyribose-phosphate aldolase